MASAQRFVVDLKNADEDRLLLGEKGSELASLSSLGINILDGFIVTAEAYFQFLKENNLQLKIKHLLESHNENSESLKAVAKHIRTNILRADIPDDVLNQIFSSYRGLGWKDKAVSAVPSPTDPHLKLLPKTNIKGEAALLQDIKGIWASYFEHELLLHRQQLSLNHFRTAIAVIVQKDLPSRKSGYIQNNKITVEKGGTLSKKEEEELLEIEKKVLSQCFFPKKINWIISKGKSYVTYFGPTIGLRVEQKQAAEPGETNVSKGRIVTGVVRVVSSPKDMEKVRNDEILILQALKNYDDIKVLKQAKALIVGSEINNQHIKLLLDKMGLPVVVDKNAKGKFRSGMVATIDGTRGQVYPGEFRLD